MAQWRSDSSNDQVRSTPLVRLSVAAAIVAAMAVLWFSNVLLTDRFTATSRNQGQLRAALYSGSIQSILQRHSVVPLILSRDSVLISALQSQDYQLTSQRLIDFQEELGAASIELLDVTGRVVAASDRHALSTNKSDQPYFTQALRESGTIFATSEPGEGAIGFHYARKVVDGLNTLGIIVVTVDLQRIEDSWRRSDVIAFVTDGSDNIILASRPSWRNQKLEDILRTEEPNAVQRAISNRGVDGDQYNYVYIDDTPLLRNETKVGFRGWRLTYFSTLENIRARVNAVLAFEIMLMTLLAAAVVYFLSRRTARQSLLIRRESEELRALNARLSAEIEERQRVERTLEDTEQSLEQASKLAALGQMSAAVSHELNQPLAAMRTYLAGARLLIARNRSSEALSSFQRIDDLIERMGAITRQLKSYARKSNDDLQPLDLRDTVTGSLSMMTPQLSQSRVEILRRVPNSPVIVMGDAVRLEQIVVNLLRNALDATKGQDERKIEISLMAGQPNVRLTVRDNGHGLEDTDSLFEPFYTTKKPGEGIGLGLAISAGIASELGGRLIARNHPEGGAVFELQLPLHQPTTRAAE
ncbi:sensor histidine kinase [Oceanomicrobium pacificus]|uniref:C4-dicarboxylate transport sensor protein DctB n=1 Tax=Oceanomicrobium pacificus TaxID=2692916 RepID=A0A6B0TX68_9RHOB|nr:ATP-binding protein [Oceanomicrobium pacificus]MXU65744.1 sensor histidine kinase [Oceanomicrobium pacificus]